MAMADVKAKTPVTVLHELTMKEGEVPEYKYLGQTGPPHMPVFRYACAALGQESEAEGSCKRTAKQEAAARLLSALGGPTDSSRTSATVTSLAHHVALLRELCSECRLPAPRYDLVADTGPAHSRRFEVRVSVGAHERVAAAATKKEARRDAAAELYRYLRQYLPKRTEHFVEDEALARAVATASRRAPQPQPASQSVWRPALDLRVAEYHAALPDSARTSAAISSSEATSSPPDFSSARSEAAAGDWEAALSSLRLPYHWDALDSDDSEMCVDCLVVENTTPALTFLGIGPRGEEGGRVMASRQAVCYLTAMLAEV